VDRRYSVSARAPQLAAVMAVRPHTGQDRNARGLFPAAEGDRIIPDEVFIKIE
jgi:hypothetical protein